MKPVSDRRRRRDANYDEQRQAAFARANGWCEAMVLGCTGRAEQTHHIEGRGGDDPHRLENLKVMCAHCHRWTHDNPRRARNLGLMRSRMSQVRPSALRQEDAS